MFSFHDGRPTCLYSSECEGCTIAKNTSAETMAPKVRVDTIGKLPLILLLKVQLSFSTESARMFVAQCAILHPVHFICQC